MHFRVFWRVQKEKQAKVSFNGWKTMTYIKTLKIKIYTHMAAGSKMFILIC